MRRYSNDPRTITVKYTGECASCNSVLRKGSFAYYWPSDGKLYCKTCDESDYLYFLSSADDEEVFMGTGNPF